MSKKLLNAKQFVDEILKQYGCYNPKMLIFLSSFFPESELIESYIIEKYENCGGYIP